VTAQPTDDAPPRPRPRPRPTAPAAAPTGRPAAQAAAPLPAVRPVGPAAGSAIVTAARVGRLLGRSGWRIAKQLPGVAAVEQRAQRLGRAAAAELGRLLEPVPPRPAAGAEEQRLTMLLADAGRDPEPLRSAMTELLDRSAGSSGGQSRDYLFGTIVSQLVPDEARILAALAAGQGAVPVVDVVAKQVGRPTTRVVAANLSALGARAGVALPANTPTYLGRLLGFGLIEFAAADGGPDFDALADDPAVVAARRRIDRDRLGSPRLVRKTVTLSPLGREFWAACAPTRR
jgi:hypothetical protein